MLLSNKQLASGSDDQTIRIWREHAHLCEDGEELCIHILKGHTGSITCMTQLDNARLVTGSVDYTARVWGLDGECMQVLHGHSGAVRSIAELPGSKILTGSYDYTCRV